MVLKRMDFVGSKDVINSLPDHLICYILSFLTTKEAASTSALARKWQYLFSFSPNLDFDNSIYLNTKQEKSLITREDIMEMTTEKKNKISKSFIDFVDRVLTLKGNSLVKKFSLKIEDGVDPIRIISWILNVLERRVSELVLQIDLDWESPLPSKIFVSETLVTLKIKFQDGPTIDVEDVFLPNLKTLYIKSVLFEKKGLWLEKLLSGCHILEELVLKDICWYSWDFYFVSIRTLKRLKFRWAELDENPKSVSFDTRNLVYLDYSENIAGKYPRVNFESLIEARIGLRMTKNQRSEAHFKEEAVHIYYAGGHEENNMVGNATNFIMAICNVKILYLSAGTLEVLTYCCKEIPLFNNLSHLTIESHHRVGWESLSSLLKNSPYLETLVLDGLNHKATYRCGDVCVCKSYYNKKEKKNIHICLSSSPVKVLEVFKFGNPYADDLYEHIAQVRHFLETMPNLEQLIVYYDTPEEDYVIEVFLQLHGFSIAASSKCNIQVISDNFSMSSNEWGPLP